jgi:hypothetical protein
MDAIEAFGLRAALNKVRDQLGESSAIKRLGNSKRRV